MEVVRLTIPQEDDFLFQEVKAIPSVVSSGDTTKFVPLLLYFSDALLGTPFALRVSPLSPRVPSCPRGNRLAMIPNGMTLSF